MDETERALRAKEILSNPVYQEAVEEFKKEILSQWSNTLLTDKDKREALHHFYKALEGIEAHFRGYVSALAQKQAPNIEIPI